MSQAIGYPTLHKLSRLTLSKMRWSVEWLARIGGTQVGEPKKKQFVTKKEAVAFLKERFPVKRKKYA